MQKVTFFSLSYSCAEQFHSIVPDFKRMTKVASTAGAWGSSQRTEKLNRRCHDISRRIYICGQKNSKPTFSRWVVKKTTEYNSRVSGHTWPTDGRHIVAITTGGPLRLSEQVEQGERPTCTSCHEAVDFLAMPLFISRSTPLTSAPAMDADSLEGKRSRQDHGENSNH
jgi:hypothetical protein